MISRTCDGSSRKTARTRTLYQTCVRPPRAPLSIFEPPLISRNRDDGDRPRPIEFGIQTARLCQIAVRSDELRGGLKNNILERRGRGGGRGGGGRVDGGRLPRHAAETDP